MHTGKIIDCRLRPPSPEFKDQFKALDNALMSRTRSKVGGSLSEWLKQDLKSFASEMRELNIVGVVVGRLNYTGLPPVLNEHIKELVDNYPGLYIPIGSIDYSNRKIAREEIEKVARWGFKGISFFLPAGVSPDERILYPIYEQLAASGLVYYVVTSPYYTTTPASFDRVAADFPNLKILLAHGGYPYIQEMIGLVWRRPNVWYCPDCYSFSPGARLYVEACNFSTDEPKYFAYPYMQQLQDRYCFGSAIPYSPPLKVRLEEWKALGWKEEILGKLLYKNAAELFGSFSEHGECDFINSEKG